MTSWTFQFHVGLCALTSAPPLPCIPHTAMLQLNPPRISPPLPVPFLISFPAAITTMAGHGRQTLLTSNTHPFALPFGVSAPSACLLSAAPDLQRVPGPPRFFPRANVITFFLLLNPPLILLPVACPTQLPTEFLLLKTRKDSFPPVTGSPVPVRRRILSTTRRLPPQHLSTNFSCVL